VLEIRKLSAGRTAVIGEVCRLGEQLQAPITGDPCLWWLVNVGGERVDSLGVDFLLRDGRDEVLVRAASIEVQTPNSREFAPSSVPEWRALVSRWLVDTGRPPLKSKASAIEFRLVEGVVVEARGWLVDGGAADGAYRVAEKPRELVARGGPVQIIFLAPKTPAR
jgi:hypothetical protein